MHLRACATMIDRSKLENVILVADRGYENYNIFAHAIEVCCGIFMCQMLKTEPNRRLTVL